MLVMNYFENTKFSHYRFSSSEMNRMYDENLEPIFIGQNVQYIVCADGCDFETAQKEMKNLFELIQKVKQNPNYSYLQIKFVNVKSEFLSEESYNPILVVDKDTWMFIKGMLVMTWFNTES